MAPKPRRSAAVAAVAAMAIAADEPDMEDLVQPERPEKKTKVEPVAVMTSTTTSNSAGNILQHHEAVHDFDMKELRDVRANLLRWYDAHRRKLPWRGDPAPYLTTATHTKQSVVAAKSKKKAGAMDAFVAVKIKTEEEQPLDDVEHVDQQHGDDTNGAALAGSCEPPRKVSPYETWVSEIMLQQTRVDTVVDYFLRWTDKFPTVEALANGSEEDVNALWAGLGYYRRARMLHSGAKYVVENFGGELPSSIEQLLTIPGIGPYTAGAISSIAFGNREPLVDGNVIRVLARLRAVGADPKNKQLIKFSWKAAGELVEECDRPGELNQALMELGATVCSVQNPECARCPVRASCLAYEETQSRAKITPQQAESPGAECSLCDFSRYDEWSDALTDVAKYPLRAKKGDSKNEVICVSVVSYESDAVDGGALSTSARGTSKLHVPANWKFLMAKRPAEGLLAGQWEFVHKKVADGEKIPAFSQRKKLMDARFAELLSTDAVASITAASRAQSSGCQRRDLGELTHIFSHIKHHMGVEHVHFPAEPALLVLRDQKKRKEANDAHVDGPPAPTIRWMTTLEMQQLGITTGVKKILSLVAATPSTLAAAVAKTKSVKPRSGNATSSSKPRRSRSSAASARSESSTSPSPSAPKRMKTLTSFFTK